MIKLCDEWGNDETMDVLFSPFRDSKEVNPHSWDRKMKFWTDMIMQYCRESGIVMFESKKLPIFFERKGKIPVCLNKVVVELIQKRQLQTYEEFSAESTWLKWGLNWVVKKPAVWTINTFVKQPLSWTLSKFIGYEQNEDHNAQNIRLVVTDIVKEKAELLLQSHHDRISNDAVDCIIAYNDLYQENKDLFKDEENFDVTLLYLVKNNKCAIFEADNKQKIVRFAKSNKRSVTPPTESDAQIYKLKSTELHLQSQIEKLSNEIIKLKGEAKDYIRLGMKPTALNVLRKKKKIESVRSQKEVALENIQQLLLSIQETDSQKMILDAYSSGSEAFKQLTKDHGLTPNKIDDIRDEMEETFEVQEDINRSLSFNPGSIDPSMQELEEELSDILSKGSSKSFLEDLPEVPSHKPVGFGFVAAENNLELELPDVPTFSPSKADKTSTFSTTGFH